MTNRKMWFGTKGNMRWIKTPAIDYNASRTGYSNEMQFLNGGLSRQRSFGSHQSLMLSWNYQSIRDASDITDYADGMYGNGLLYMSYPFAMDSNVFPKGWAFPGQATLGGYSIMNNGDLRADIPQQIPTSSNPNKYPSVSAVYNVRPGQVTKSCYIPIPPGHTLWIGAAGAAGTGGTLTVRPMNGAGYSGTASNFILRSVQNPQWWEAGIPASATTDGVEIRLGGAGTVTLTGLMAQVLPNGVQPAADGFKSGEGMAGAEFAEMPSVTHYSHALDMIGISATLVEVEPWL